MSTTRSFRWALRLTLAGLVVELVSLFGLKHPWGFMLFATLGCTLIAGGIVLYFAAALRHDDTQV